MPRWFLECFAGSGKTLNRIPLDHFPFSVGRSAESALTLDSPDVSRFHGEIVSVDGHLLVRDAGSTNGIFVNHSRIRTDTPLKHGDIVHFANVEYRLICEDDSHCREAEQTIVGICNLSHRMPTGLLEFQELMEQSLVTVVLQPIVSSHDHRLFAYEILGRGCHPDLPVSPFPLFKIAESTNKEIELSELLMNQGVAIIDALHRNTPFFINTHPRELDNLKRLTTNLTELRRAHRDPALVLEIHEEAVTDLATIRTLRRHLDKLDIKLAYDDFGAGQARLLELVDAPPDFLKFDIKFINDIEIASPMRLQILEALMKICSTAGIKTLAEGVDSHKKASICRDLGFDLLQGYLFPFLTLESATV